MDTIDKINELSEKFTNNLMSECFDAFSLGFDFWEDALGSGVDSCEYLEKYLNDKAVIGWKTNISFEETDKIIPDFIKAIMANKEPDIPYVKDDYYVKVWHDVIDGFPCLLLKTPFPTNDDGWDYVEYWYFLALGK